MKLLRSQKLGDLGDGMGWVIILFQPDDMYTNIMNLVMICSEIFCEEAVKDWSDIVLFGWLYYIHRHEKHRNTRNTRGNICFCSHCNYVYTSYDMILCSSSDSKRHQRMPMGRFPQSLAVWLLLRQLIWRGLETGITSQYWGDTQ